MPAAMVVVVGAGLAGLVAALEAAWNGAAVTLIDKEPRPAMCNSAKASSGINSVGTPVQEAFHIADSAELLREDTIRSGAGLSSTELVATLANGARGAFDFLTGLGVDLSELSLCGGHSVARTHRNKEGDGQAALNVGRHLVDVLVQRLRGMEKEGRCQIRFSTRATRLLVAESGSRIVGVIAETESGNATETHHLLADSVVLATGGFAGDLGPASLLGEVAPHLLNLPTTNGPAADGSGMRMARAAGAKLMHLDRVQLHPTGFVHPTKYKDKTKFLAPESLRGLGGILFDQQGRRFVNELSTRDAVSASILQHGWPLHGDGPTVAVLAMNQSVLDAFGKSKSSFYTQFGLIRRASNIGEFVAQAGLTCSPEDVALSLSSYGRVALDQFGRQSFPSLFQVEGPVFWAYVTPSLHYCMGGVAFDREARVLDTHSQPIGGLFVAGEASGGLHGENRLAGNSLLECVVFGRIAGRNASIRQ